MKTSRIGSIGENVACAYLERHGHQILERNFRVRYGEIDIISSKRGELYFGEVKAVEATGALSGSARPEERVDYWKLKRLSKAVQIYLGQHRSSYNGSCRFLVISVMLDTVTKIARVRMIEDVLE